MTSHDKLTERRDNQSDVVILGAGLAGLTTALLIARIGARVTVLERDPAPPPAFGADIWLEWDRPGVNQFRYRHLMLPRWYRDIAAELPEVLTELACAGVPTTNLLGLQPDHVRTGWTPADDDFRTVAARRPTVESVLARVASANAGIQVRRGDPGHRSHDDEQASPGGHRRGHDHGNRAGGPRRRRARPAYPGAVLAERRWRARPLPARRPGEFVYYCRHFAVRDRLPHTAAGGVLIHEPGMSMLTLPGDRGTYAIVLAVHGRDRRYRDLRGEDRWSEAADVNPVTAAWRAAGNPVTPVMPMAGLADVTYDATYARGGAGWDPAAAGLVAVGDAYAATTPLLGRGSTLALLAGLALRDALDGGHSSGDWTRRFCALMASRVDPWVDATVSFSRHRLAELAADEAHEPYVPDDPAWAAAVALRRGAAHDPALARASGRIGAMLDLPLRRAPATIRPTQVTRPSSTQRTETEQSWASSTT